MRAHFHIRPKRRDIQLTPAAAPNIRILHPLPRFTSHCTGPRYSRKRRGLSCLEYSATYAGRELDIGRGPPFPFTAVFSRRNCESSPPPRLMQPFSTGTLQRDSTTSMSMSSVLLWTCGPSAVTLLATYSCGTHTLVILEVLMCFDLAHTRSGDTKLPTSN